MPNTAVSYADRRLALALLALALACGRSDPPRLETSPLPGTESANAAEIRYQLRNVGGRPLALDGVAPLCGCAPAAALPESLVADASAVLDLRCRLPRTVGSATRELRILSGDPTRPAIVLPVTLPGRGAGPDPDALYFGYVAVGESAVRDVVLPAPLAVAGVALPADSPLALEPMPARADAPYGVRIRVTPKAPGVLRAAIDLGAGVGSLPVVAVGYAGLLAFPAEVRLPHAGGGVFPTITLVELADEPLTITHVEYPPGLTGELRTVIPGRQFRLVLRARGHVGAGAISLRGDAGAPLLVLPVVGAAAPSA